MPAILDPALRRLTLAERIQLVEDLWDSIAADNEALVLPTPEQVAEARRRWAEHQQDPASAVPWEALRAELLAKTQA